ncbi:hypothetical protein [Bacteroides graminisolvens]|uniref:hypothetical protein n=1 Tax=Bacteroides graminisolvens TaxID=477666 RepID=UPI00055834C7|nr:hypothetical protein [Bacteroides graminisolvens]
MKRKKKKKTITTEKKKLMTDKTDNTATRDNTYKLERNMKQTPQNGTAETTIAKHDRKKVKRNQYTQSKQTVK